MQQQIVHEPGKVPGIRITLGASDYIVPPLNLIGFEQHEEQIMQLVGDTVTSTSAKFNMICAIALSALQRNYPDLTLDFMKKWIDLANMADIFMAVMAQSGMRTAQPGEGQASALTGPRSTDASLLPPAGNGATSAVN